MWNSLRYLDSQRKLAQASFSGGERDHLFLNLHAREFRDVAGVSGLDAPGDGRVFVHWDYDRDGWQDFAVANTNSPMLNLYRNVIGRGKPTPNFIALRFVGGNTAAAPSSEWSNRNGYGAKVTAVVADRKLIREHRCGEGLAAQNSATMLVGLGDATTVEHLVVRWPSGKESTLTSLNAGQLVTVFEDPTASPDGSGVTTRDYLARPDEGATPLAESIPLDAKQFLNANFAPDGDRAANLRAYTSMASWCESCKRWLPQLKQLREELGGNELNLYGVPIDLQDSPQVLADYLQKNEPPYELLAALPDEDRTAFQDYVKQRLNTDALPSTVVVDAAGHVLLTTQGVPTVSEIRRLLAAQRASP